MQIEANKVVSIDYILRNDEGNILDQSAPEAPLTYIHGHQNIIPGLENELNNQSIGASITVTVPPAEAYGEYDDTLIQSVPRTMFEGVDNIEIGMQFQAQLGEGVQIVTVTEVTNDTVTIDANHDLAGKTLHFEASVRDIRDATQDEISNGQIQSSCCNESSDCCN